MNSQDYKNVMARIEIDDKCRDRILDAAQKISDKEHIIMNKNEVNEPVEVIKRTPWYRSHGLALAASFVLVAGAAAVGTSGILKREPESGVVYELEDHEDSPYVNWEIRDDSVIFRAADDIGGEIRCYVASTLKGKAECTRREAAFTPLEDGRYAVRILGSQEDIVEDENNKDLHFHYLYAICSDYLLTVEEGNIEVKPMGYINEFSDECVADEKAKLKTEDPDEFVCYDVCTDRARVYAESSYFDLANKLLGEDAYIMTVYSDSYPTSYFCVNTECNDGGEYEPYNEAAAPDDRISISDSGAASIGDEYANPSGKIHAHDRNGETVDVLYAEAIGDGKVTISVEKSGSFKLKVKNYVFEY